jgi:hypothetical protein
MSSAILDIMDPPTLSIAIFHHSENQRNKDTERESESLQVKEAQRMRKGILLPYFGKICAKSTGTDCSMK